MSFSEDDANPRSYGGYLTGKIVSAARHADTYEWIYTIEKSLTHATGEKVNELARSGTNLGKNKKSKSSNKSPAAPSPRSGSAATGAAPGAPSFASRFIFAPQHTTKPKLPSVHAVLVTYPEGRVRLLKDAELPFVGKKTRSVGVVMPEMPQYVFKAEVIEKIEVTAEIKGVHDV